MENQEIIEVPGFVANDSTLAFGLVPESNQFVQVCPHSINSFTTDGRVARLETPVQHASLRGNQLAISAPASKSVQFLEYDGAQFNVRTTLEVNDDLSSVHLASNGSLVVSTWSRMAVIVFDLAAGTSTDFSTALVVRSFCELAGTLYMGTSRGQVHAARLNEDGSLTALTDQSVVSGTVSLNTVTVGSSDFVFVAAGPSSKLVSLESSTLNVFPIAIDKSIHSQAQGPDGAVYLLAPHELVRGAFATPAPRRLTQRRFDSPITHLASLDTEIAAAFASGEVQILGSSQFETVASFGLPPAQPCIALNTFAFGDQKYLQASLADPLKRVPQRFSEPGSILTYVIGPTPLLCDARIDLDTFPSAVKFVDGYLIVAAGSKISKFSVTQHSGSQLTFTEVSVVDGSMVAVDLAVERGVVAVFDIFASASLYDSELQRLAVDAFAKGIVAGIFTGPNTLLVSDSRGNVYTLERRDGRLSTTGRYSIGEKVTAVLRWRALPAGSWETFVGVTSAGAIIAFTELGEDRFAAAAAIQMALAERDEAESGISHTQYRAIVSPGYSETSFGFVDGDLLLAAKDLEGGEKAAILEGSQAEELVDAVDSLITDLTLN
jgi:hypothetical protein